LEIVNPTGTELRHGFQGKWKNEQDYHVMRVHGWLTPPQSGDYTFWIAANDVGELWLSTDADPNNAKLIASVPSGAGGDPCQWDANPAQKSLPITLQALQKEGTGRDHVAAAWQGPGIAATTLISAQYVDTFALPPVAPTMVLSLLTNGGFESGQIAPYGLYGTGTATVVTDCAGAAVPEGPVEGKCCLHVVVPAAGTNNWDVGMTQNNFVWQKGKKYTFSCFFKVKQGTLQFCMKPEHAAGNYEGYGDTVFTGTDRWQEYHVTTPIFTSDVNPGSPTFHFAFAAGDFWVDAVRVYEGDYIPSR
jgi:hypothetical protein